MSGHTLERLIREEKAQGRKEREEVEVRKQKAHSTNEDDFHTAFALLWEARGKPEFRCSEPEVYWPCVIASEELPSEVVSITDNSQPWKNATIKCARNGDECGLSLCFDLFSWGRGTKRGGLETLGRLWPTSYFKEELPDHPMLDEAARVIRAYIAKEKASLIAGLKEKIKVKEEEYAELERQEALLPSLLENLAAIDLDEEEGEGEGI